MSNEQQAQSLDEINEKFKKDMLEAFDKMTEQQVAWMYELPKLGGTYESHVDVGARPKRTAYKLNYRPLFEAPPLRDLTDAELFAAAFNFDCGARHENEEWLLRRPSQLRELANNILAKAREKV